ncbi:YbaK/EbsC family protein [Chryseobacterium sp.]|uniref:YbaK/EbsC family protein n=1 Tax=Chryseobacterium sp. TaxID=1871047 RepID=UPI00289CBC2A|nr:YbaK/EbsC family protein [Chryseobacterium sp.]
MSLEKVKQHLSQWNRESDIILLNQSSATVHQAAEALGVSVAKIAKSISLYDKDNGVIVIVASGQSKIDSKKFKERFDFKAKMLSFEDVEVLVGHPVGGVCPFGVNDGVKVFLDLSLKHFNYVYPACGTVNSAIKLTIPELEKYSLSEEWVDVTKD